VNIGDEYYNVVDITITFVSPYEEIEVGDLYVLGCLEGERRGQPELL
jgi:hypothetical protein